MESSNDELTKVYRLPLARSPADQKPLDIQEISNVADKVKRSKTGWGEAYRAAANRSGLLDAEIADALEISESMMSQVFTGKKSLAKDREVPFNRVVGNVLILAVAAYLEGYEIRPMQSELERQNTALRQQVEELERDREVITRFLRETKTA